jgi:ABC-type transport system involved in multi-copper enzyme maturation permease subunit
MSTLVQQPAAPSGSAPEPPRRQGSAPVRLIRAELLKIWTTNSWWIFAICAFAATALAMLINIIQAHIEYDQAKNPPDFGDVPPPEEGGPSEFDRDFQFNLARVILRNTANVYTSGQFFGLLFVMLLGTLIVTNEFYHQTATATFLTTPRRTSVILAKLGAAVGLAGFFWLVTTIIDLGVGTLFLQDAGYPMSLDEWPVIRAILFNLPAYAIWAVLGVGLGVLIRSQLGATLTGAGLYLIAGQVAQVAFFIIYQFWIKEDWVIKAMVALPSVASQIMISADRVPLGPGVLGPPWWVGALVLIGYGLVAGTIGTLITRKRDIS